LGAGIFRPIPGGRRNTQRISAFLSGWKPVKKATPEKKVRRIMNENQWRSLKALGELVHHGSVQGVRKVVQKLATPHQKTFGPTRWTSRKTGSQKGGGSGPANGKKKKEELGGGGGVGSRKGAVHPKITRAETHQPQKRGATGTLTVNRHVLHTLIKNAGKKGSRGGNEGGEGGFKVCCC